MNITKSIALTLGVAGAMATSGCLMANMGTLQEATKPVEQNQYTVLGDRVQGVDSQWMLWSLSTAKPGSPSLRALDDAKAKVPGTDALVEVSQNVETYMYPIPPFFILQNVRTRVTGTPVKFDSKK